MLTKLLSYYEAIMFLNDNDTSPPYIVCAEKYIEVDSVISVIKYISSE